MNELIEAARDALDLIEKIDTGIYLTDEVVSNLRAAVERAERQEAVGFEEWWVTPNGCLNKYECETAWTAAQQAERERIRARAQIAAEKTWPAGDWFIGPQHANMEQFVEELLRDDDEQS